MTFDETPCATCKGTDPKPIGLAFQDSVAVVFGDPAREARFRDFVQRFCSLSDEHQKIYWYIHDNPGLSGRAYAKALGIADKTFRDSVRAILAGVPELERLIHRESRH